MPKLPPLNPNLSPASTRSTTYLQGPTSSSVDSPPSHQRTQELAEVSITVPVDIPPPERTLPQAIALEDLARDEADKTAVQSRPSESTRIFTPNLSNPALRPSVPPGAASTPMFTPDLKLRAPVSERASKPSNLDSGQDETRTYTADAIHRLVHEIEGAEASVVEDVSRVKSHLPTERDVTSPGNRAANVPLVVIAPDSSSRSKRRYLWLALVLPVAFLGVFYRASIERDVAKVTAWVNRGIDRTRGNGAATVTEIAVSISVSPADATLLVDGVSVPNPLAYHLRPDQKNHEIVARAPGYESVTRSVRFERDLTVMLGLAPLPVPAVASVSAVSIPVAAPVPAAKVGGRFEPKAKVKAKTNCEPPFTIDENGIKNFKPECL